MHVLNERSPVVWSSFTRTVEESTAFALAVPEMTRAEPKGAVVTLSC